MRRVLLLLGITGLLLAQAPRSSLTQVDMTDLLARLEVTVPNLQRQLDDQTQQLRSLNDKVASLNISLAEVNTKLSFLISIASALGTAVLAGIVGLYFKRREHIPPFEQVTPNPPSGDSPLSPGKRRFNI